MLNKLFICVIINFESIEGGRMKKIKKPMMILLLALFLMGSTGIYATQQIVKFSNVYLTFTPGGNYKTAGAYSHKYHTNRNYVVNLKGDRGDAWIDTKQVNSNGETRGHGSIQRGTRATFRSTGAAGRGYVLKVRKTNPGTVSISGSWASDSY